MSRVNTPFEVKSLLITKLVLKQSTVLNNLDYSITYENKEEKAEKIINYNRTIGVISQVS